MPTTACVVCNCTTHRVVFQEFGIDILRCAACGHVFSSYEFTQNYEGYFAERVESADQFWWNAAHQEMYDGFCRRFIDGKSGKLLDVGCGLGYFVKRVSACASWQAFGREISREAVDFATTRLGLPNVSCGRVEDSPFPAKTFDIITLWDVIEHIPNPDPLLSRLPGLLKEEGILFLHTPNVNIQLPKAKLKKFIRGMRPDLHYLEAKDHANIYSPDTLSRVLRRNGFKDIRCMHLKPIQSMAGSRSNLLRALKNLWFYSSAALFHATLGRVNLDNLFVTARLSDSALEDAAARGEQE